MSIAVSGRGTRGHGASDDDFGGPPARGALRGRLGGRVVRPAAHRAVRQRSRLPRRRGGVRRPGGPPRADGAGHLPADPGRPSSCRGRLPGRLLRAGPPGTLRPGSRPAEPLALRRRVADGAQGADPARPAPPARGEPGRESSRGVPGGSRRPGCPRGRAGRGPPRRDRPPARVVAAAGGALLLRGPLAGRGRASAPMPRRDRPQPPGPRPGEAPHRPDPPGRGPLDDGHGGRAGAPIGLGVHSSPPVRFHHPGRDRLRGPSRRRRRPLGSRRGPGPGGPA